MRLEDEVGPGFGDEGELGVAPVPVAVAVAHAALIRQATTPIATILGAKLCDLGFLTTSLP